MAIKPADKGGKIVLWPTQLHIEEANRQLGDNNYYQEQVEDKIPALSMSDLNSDNNLPTKYYT